MKLAGMPVAALLAQDAALTSGTLGLQDARRGSGGAATYFLGRTQQLKNLRVGNWRIAPGGSPHNIHQHPDEELLIVTEGTGTVTVDGKTTRVGPGSIMYCAGNLPHGLHNTGDAPLFFYFIRWIA